MCRMNGVYKKRQLMLKFQKVRRTWKIFMTIQKAPYSIVPKIKINNTT